MRQLTLRDKLLEIYAGREKSSDNLENVGNANNVGYAGNVGNTENNGNANSVSNVNIDNSSRANKVNNTNNAGNINNKHLVQCVTNYLHKKYDDKKIQRIIDNIHKRHNLEEESVKLKRRNQLSIYIDSIILSRIRDSYKSSKPLDMDSLDEWKFKALIKQVLIHFGYEILYVPVNNNKGIDIIVNRKDKKMAVLAIRRDDESLVGAKTIRQLRYMANYYHCERALLFTNTYFSREASSEAFETGVTLFDRNKLVLLVQDLVDGRQQEEKKCLINEMEEFKRTIYLEGEIKFPKTKVQVIYVKYHVDENSGSLIFEGKLINTS
ncbi:MAG: restriction endonuclease [Clostridiaceae bacterium]|nr:restriction endonuclease [Clostridiaceae bacterium]